MKNTEKIAGKEPNLEGKQVKTPNTGNNSEIEGIILFIKLYKFAPLYKLQRNGGLITAVLQRA